MELPFPDSKTVTQLFYTLTGKPVTVKVMRDKLTPSAANLVFAGLFLADESEKPSAAVLFDFQLSIYISGTLIGLPAPVMGQQIKSREITDMLRSNMAEVFNITGGMYNATGSPHVRLLKIEEIPGKFEGALAELVNSPLVQRLDLEITLPQCLPSRLAFIREKSA